MCNVFDMKAATTICTTVNTTPTNVWCTLVMLREEYACGAVVVARSLRNVGTKYPIWCMASEDISEDCVEFLGRHFDRVVRVPLISHATQSMKSRKQNEIYGSWIRSGFTKWNVMNPDLFPVSKVILLDADMLFVENCDDLFEIRAPAATFSSPWVTPYVGRQRFNTHNHYGEMAHGQKVNHALIRKGFANGILCLACMVLIQPNAKMYDTMIKLLNRDEKYGSNRCTSGFDEQLLAETMLAMNVPVYHIHQRYNWVVGKYNWLLNGEKPKTQQYYNGKPWRGIPTPDDRHIVEECEWDDIRDWWKIGDQVMKTDPQSPKWFYPGLSVLTSNSTTL